MSQATQILEAIQRGRLLPLVYQELRRLAAFKMANEALKVIKLGMDTRSVIARFEVERQALAMMDHPNIAKVFDAGATESPLTRPPGTRSPTGGEGRGEGESAESQIANRKSQIPGGRPYFVMEL